MPALPNSVGIVELDMFASSSSGRHDDDEIMKTSSGHPTSFLDALFHAWSAPAGGGGGPCTYTLTPKCDTPLFRSRTPRTIIALYRAGCHMDQLSERHHRRCYPIMIQHADGDDHDHDDDDDDDEDLPRVTFLFSLCLQGGTGVAHHPHPLPETITLSLLCALIELGADMNRLQQHVYGTALCAAISSQRFEMAKMLIVMGVDVTDVIRRNSMGPDVIYSPIMCAVQQPSSERVVELLVAYGAPLDEVNRDGWTPFIAATIHKNIGVMRVLHRLGADIHRTSPSALGNNSFTPLMIACDAPDSSCQSTHGSPTTTLMNSQPSANMTTASAIHVMEALLDMADKKELKVMMKAKDRQGRTALEMVQRRGDVEKERLLKQKRSECPVS